MSRPLFGVPHYEYERLGPDCSTLAAAICTTGGGLGDDFMLDGGGSPPDCNRWESSMDFQTQSPWSSGPEMTSANRPPPSSTPVPMLPEERLWLFEFPPSPPPPPPQHAPPRHDVYYFPPHEHYCPSPSQSSAPCHGGPCIYHPPSSPWWSNHEYGDGDILFHLQPPRPPPQPPRPHSPPPHHLPPPPWASGWTWGGGGMRMQEPYESMPISAMEDSDVEDDMMFRVERDAPSAPPPPSPTPSAPPPPPSQRNKPPPSSALGEREVAAMSARRRTPRGGLVPQPTNDSMGFPDEPPTRDSGPTPPSGDAWTLRPRAERPEEEDGQNSRLQGEASNFTDPFLGCEDNTDFMETACVCNGDMRCGGDTPASCMCGSCGGDPGASVATFVGEAGAGEGACSPPTPCLPAAAAGATTTATTTTLTTAASALTSSVASSPSPASPTTTSAVAAAAAATTTPSSAPASSSTLTANTCPSRKMTLSHGHGFRALPSEQTRTKPRPCMRAL